MKFNRNKPPKNVIKRARSLRREMTKPERILWQKLRELPCESELTFRRQHPLPPYVVDFACIKIKLAIELDGESHDTRQLIDKKRDDYLEKLGYRVLRFTNDDLMNNADSIVETIIHEASKRLKNSRQQVSTPHPTLPPRGEGFL